MKILQKMLGKPTSQNQKNLFQPLLREFIDLNHELVLLGEKMDWNKLEKEFSILYSNTGAPSKPIRLMCGLLILKQLYGYGDETLMPAWVSNPYFQYFCGEAHFNWEFPCDPSDLVHFRKRIGSKGVESIFAQSILLHGKSAQTHEICIDSTAQEKNITFPTDVKLQVKIIKGCNKLAKQLEIEQRQNYKFVLKKYLIASRFGHHPKRRKQGLKAQRKIKTIAFRLVNELGRKLSPELLEQNKAQLDIYKKVLSQKRHDSNKIYSFHEPEVACIAKGKAHKPYEFGSKVSFGITKTGNIIVAAVNFKGNPHDSKTLEETLNQHERLTGKRAEGAIVDRGYPGKKMIGETKILRADNGKQNTAYQKKKQRGRFERRAAIEPIISHTKHQYGMARNYLKGTAGDEINAMMAAAAYNFKSWINKTKTKLICAIFCLNNFFKNLLQYIYQTNLRLSC